MEVLRKKRGVLKGQLTRIERAISEELGENITAIDAKARLEKVEDIMKSFEEVQMEIELQLPDEDAANEVSVREDFEGKYYSLKGRCLRKMARGTPVAESSVWPNDTTLSSRSNELDETLRQLAGSQATIAAALTNLSESNRSVRASGGHSDTKLPPISLQSFSGDYREWPTFKDLFRTIVHESSVLSGAQKLQYLKLSLKDDAASVLKHTNICDANYEQAWSDLCHMYDREKVIIDAHLKTIMEQPESSCPPTAPGIRKLHSTTNESISALKALGVPVEFWDAWLIYVVSSKLDPESKRLWARSSAANPKPAFKDIMDFLTNRHFELDSVPASKGQLGSKTKINRYSVCTTISHSCSMCKGSHFVAVCPQYTKLDLNGKRSFIGQEKLCYNCLNRGHSVKSCKSGTCRKCKARHHTTIHPDGNTETKVMSCLVKEIPMGSHGETKGLIEEKLLSASALSKNVSQYGPFSNEINLLPTAVVLIRNRWGELKPCRALLDSGSQVTLITESCMQFLGLSRIKGYTAIDSVGNTESKAQGLTWVSIQSRLNGFSISSPAIVLKNITKQIPQRKVSRNIRYQFKGIELADPSFDEPSNVDILLKASILFKALKEGKIYDCNCGIIAQNTEFGFVLTGEGQNIDNRLSTLHATEGVEGMLERLWDLEEPKPTSRYLYDDHPCETHFKTHCKRDEQGRFVVRLPFKELPEINGDSRGMAERRLMSMERKFKRDPELYKQYKDFMEEYLGLGHMVAVDTNKHTTETACYYLPHHAVIKPESTTTRLRVVFDATCKPPGGNSLNSQLLTGPVLQNDLTTILLQFVQNPIALSADIAKMYRQILMHPDDRKFQCILWRDIPSAPMKTYQLTTITYGTAPASFLATRCLTQLAEDGRRKYPEASFMITNCFYMDDFLASCDDVETAERIVKELCMLLQEAGFNLRKWASNSKGLFEKIPLGKREPSWSWSVESDKPVNILGLRWHPITDCFTFKVNSNEVSCYTKRNLLSEASRIFDPLGFLTPFLINYRILLQRLWQEKIDWDEQIPLTYIKKWDILRGDLSELASLKILRYKPHNKQNLELHGFCDASEDAYAAVIYLRSINSSGEVIVSFVTAKAKVAPLKPVLVIPRLELCAAVLLSKLIGKLRTINGYEDIPVHGWTDSSIVLHWLNGHPKKYASFICNRISAITSIIPATKWHHVKGEINPADCASRGVRADQLRSHALWWSGPKPILNDPTLANFIPQFTGDRQGLEERRIVLIGIASGESEFAELWNKFSNLTTLIRVTAWILRFFHNCRGNKIKDASNWLRTTELEGAKIKLVRLVQHMHFAEEMMTLKKERSILRGQLSRLNPFLDSVGLLRVGGRIETALLSYQQKHPLILPYSSTFTKLVIWDAHHKFLHAGPQLLLALLRQDYWILRARNAVRLVKQRCVTCQRYSARPIQQLMGNLPVSRLQAEKAFQNVGVDYAGPIMATPWRKRGCRGQKVYVALFICLCTKAIHLEMVTNLTTEAFLAALKRFVARRGKCTNIYCDNGTNFVGAKQHLSEINRFLRSREVQDKLCTQASKEDIAWHFIPPSGPNFGGLWEAGVKSTKHHLRRVIGCHLLSFEELETLLCQIESCLNSRPLIPMSDSFEDFEALTPAHFLVGSVSYFLPEKDYQNVKFNSLSRFQIVSKLQQAFWKRWQLEYVTTLQQRQKWRVVKANLKPNDMVIVRDENLPPGKWALGRVKEVHLGADGLARVATLITKTGVIKRPIAKICLLDLTE